MKKTRNDWRKVEEQVKLLQPVQAEYHKLKLKHERTCQKFELEGVESRKRNQKLEDDLRSITSRYRQVQRENAGLKDQVKEYFDKAQG